MIPTTGEKPEQQRRMELRCDKAKLNKPKKKSTSHSHPEDVLEEGVGKAGAVARTLALLVRVRRAVRALMSQGNCDG